MVLSHWIRSLSSVVFKRQEPAGAVESLHDHITRIEKRLDASDTTLRAIENFQKVATEDLKKQILQIEMHLDASDTTLRGVENFQKVATEDLKKQILQIEMRLDGSPLDGPSHLTDIKYELANIKQIFDRQSLAILRLLDGRERQ